MGSTFMGLETSKRGLNTQQSALYTTGHNISNANTLGYSRQRVNMQATSGFPGVGLNAGTMPGFLGTGVEAGSIQRIRDSFVDSQYRSETNKLGYWESRSNSIGQIEDILNEPSEYGLQKSLSQFWSSLQDLATHPENGGTRKVVIERGTAVADAFNYMNKSLQELKTATGTEIEVTEMRVNSILKQIANLNGQISSIEPNGYLPNDLYDARDVLIDELSGYLPIEMGTPIKSGGNASAIAEGSVVINIKLADGSKVNLLNGKDTGQLKIEKTADAVTAITIEGAGAVASGNIDIGAMQPDKGTLKSLFTSYGDGTDKALIPQMKDSLDKLAKAFVDEFNNQHAAGYELNSDKKGEEFFTIDADGVMSVRNEIVNDPSKIAASGAANAEGNGDNAKALGQIQFTSLNSLGDASIQTYFQGIIGQLGVDGEQAAKMQFNSETLLKSVENRRASISSVSLDEEMTNMIQFQQAYNASARMITVVDETLDKIINGMGVGGR